MRGGRTNKDTLDPSETSPLLDSDSGSSSPLPKDANGTFSEPEAERPPSEGDGEVIESGAPLSGSVQGSDEAGLNNRQGLPDVAAKLPILIPAIGIGVFLCALDQLLTIATYAKIGSDLNALNNTSWVATAYFLTLTSCQPLYGKLSDIFGRKECLLFAYTVFGLGCLGCGLAQDMTQLVIARAVSGIGGGGMNAVVSILLTDIVPLADRGIWQGYINIIFAAGTSTGAPLGGLLADSVGWRWSFIGQVPLCLAAFIAVYLVLHLPARESSHWRAKLARIDFLGALALVSAVLCLLLGLDNGSNRGWSHTSTVVPLALSPALFVVFVLIEVKVASHPFAPGHVIFDRSLFASFACNFFGVGGQMPILFHLPLLYQAADGVSAVQAGVLLIPGSLVGVSASLGAGAIMKKTGRYYWLTVASVGVLLFSVVPLALFGAGLGHGAGPGTNVAGTTAGLVLTSLGAGSFITTTLIAVISNAAAEDTAVVIACSYLFRSLGSSIGISAGSAVLQQVLRTQLAARLGGDGGGGDGVAREIEERVRQSLDYIKELDPAVAGVVRCCYQFAVAAVFVCTVAMLLPAFISTFFIREKRIKR